jgi:ribonuclease-3
MLEKRINYFFKDKKLLETALTHSSYVENNQNENNERLEFLGDAVIEIIISKYLFNYSPLNEGEMTKTRAKIVCTESLFETAKKLEIGEVLFLGKGEIATGGRNRKSILANAYEALIGAIFLDSDYETSETVVLETLKENIDLALEGKLVYDFKTSLQEYIQQNNENTIYYKLEKEEGPEHNKTFFVGLYLNHRKETDGTGKSIKEAEQSAAKKYMEKKLGK